MTRILYGADTAARTRIIALNCLGPGASEWAHFAAAARPIEAAVYSRIWDNAATPNRSNEIVLVDQKPNGARHADLQKPPRHHDCEQSSTFRLARELSPRSARAGIARDRARKGPPNFAEEPFSDGPLDGLLLDMDDLELTGSRI